MYASYGSIGYDQMRYSSSPTIPILGDKASDLSVGDRFAMPRHPIYTVIGVVRQNHTVVVAVLPKSKGAVNGSYRILHLASDRTVTFHGSEEVDLRVLASVDLSSQIANMQSRSYYKEVRVQTCKRCGSKLDQSGYCTGYICYYNDHRQY